MVLAHVYTRDGLPLLPAATLLPLGSVTAALCAYLLLRRAGFRIALDRLRDGLALVFLGALVSMLISSTVGTTTDLAFGVIPASDWWRTWFVWWAGDAMGVLLITPLLLGMSRIRWRERIPVLRVAEFVALLAGVLCAGLLSSTVSSVLLVLAFPLVCWAAFRFQLAGAALCALLVSVAVTIGVGQGLFGGPNLSSDMAVLQAVNGSVALTALLISAVIAQRSALHTQAQRVCRQLAMLARAGARIGGAQGVVESACELARVCTPEFADASWST